jgi:ArsR family metal-binding transcriptional regulator
MTPARGLLEGEEMTIDVSGYNDSLAKYKCKKCGHIQTGIAIKLKNRNDEWLDFCGVCWADWMANQVGQVEVVE